MTDHAITRAKERYGMDLTEADLGEITTLCRGGAGMPVDTVANGKVYIIRYLGQVIIPLISAFGNIVTFFPHSQYSGTKRSERSNRVRWMGAKKRPKKVRDRR